MSDSNTNRIINTKQLKEVPIEELLERLAYLELLVVPNREQQLVACRKDLEEICDRLDPYSSSARASLKIFDDYFLPLIKEREEKDAAWKEQMNQFVVDEHGRRGIVGPTVNGKYMISWLDGRYTWYQEKES